MLLNVFHDTFYSKRLSLNFVILFKCNIWELRAKIGCELTRIQFANDYSLVLTQHFAGVRRQRTDIIELRQTASQGIRRGVQMTFRTTPSDQQYV